MIPKTSAMTLYAIYDPIVENEEEVYGGPWCFSINSSRAYLAFPSAKLAEDFLKKWDSPGEHIIVPIQSLGDEYQELVDDVEYLLVLPSTSDISHLIQDIDHFPYRNFLLDRETQWLH